MGRINKALNRSNYKHTSGHSFSNPRFGSRFQQSEYNQRNVQREEKKDLKIIEISSDQQARKDIKFVFELPQTVKKVKEILDGKPDQDKIVILQRIRDYYNPILEPKNTDKFKQFVVCLTSYYLQRDLESESVKQHLKELASSQGILFSAFLKSKIQKILAVLKDVIEHRDDLSADQLEQIDKLLGQVIECQILVISVLECPTNSKLLEILEQITGHIYQHSSLFLPKQKESIMTLLQNDVDICSKLHKKFNPALSMIFLKLVSSNDHSTKLATLYDTYETKVLQTMPATSILNCELIKQLKSNKKLLKKRPSQNPDDIPLTVRQNLSTLTHLRLFSKKPKELPSFNPQIDEDFMAAALDDKTYKDKKDDPKDIKRKTKKAEKDAIRELRKDTQQLQVQKEREVQQRKQIFLKGVIRGGNNRDDA